MLNNSLNPQISDIMMSTSDGLNNGDIIIWSITPFNKSSTISTDSEYESIRYSIYTKGELSEASTLIKNELNEYQIIYNPWVITLTILHYVPDRVQIIMHSSLENGLGTNGQVLDVDGSWPKFVRAPYFVVKTEVEAVPSLTEPNVNRVYTYTTDEELAIIRVNYVKETYEWGIDAIKTEIINKLNPESWMKITDIMVSLIKDRFVQRGTLKIPPAASASDYTLTYQYPFETVPTLEFANNNAYDATVTTTGATIRLSAHTETMFLDWIAWTE
jgi:hypothetical protein